jgi:hypothetical protein
MAGQPALRAAPVPVTANPALAEGLALLALVSTVLVGAVVVALHLLRPDVAPLARGISHYANGPAGGLMRLATALLGLGGLALVAGLALGIAPAARSVAGLALLGLWSVAQLVTAGFPIDAPGAPPTTAGAIHGLAGLSFVLPVGAALLLARGYPRDPRWAPVARPARALGLALLAAAVALYLLIEPLAGLGVGGLAQRVYWVVLLAWLACTALWLRAAVGAGDRTPARLSPSAP